MDINKKTDSPRSTCDVTSLPTSGCVSSASCQARAVALWSSGCGSHTMPPSLHRWATRDCSTSRWFTFNTVVSTLLRCSSVTAWDARPTSFVPSSLRGQGGSWVHSFLWTQSSHNFTRVVTVDASSVPATAVAAR